MPPQPTTSDCHVLQVYKAFLEELQFYGFLAIADVQKIFANLSELVEVGSGAGDCDHFRAPYLVECEYGY